MTDSQKLARTLGELKASGYRPCTVKEEMRRNLVAKLRAGAPVFPGIVGYDETVIPQIQNAILARHDFLLLGLRGQAKTRLVRSLAALLDEFVPVIEGSPVNEDPLQPITKYGRELVAARGDETPVAWLPRERRYQEKLATPDVTIADLIGDVDPIKAVSRKLDFSDEEVIHYGIIPRSNRGIFAINELPDLQPRIQVGLLNIMEEKDLQIRGFPIRMPLDLCIVYTANPEDYTNRGNIITPLKDRIDAQIITHYPESLEEAMSITAQEAELDHVAEGATVHVPQLFRELVERVAFEARKSEYIDRNSGVSVRMSITLMETVAAAAERRALVNGDARTAVRVADLFGGVTAITGKVELVYRGEQEGPQNVAQFLVGRAIKEAFNTRFVPNYKPGKEQKYAFGQFQEIVNWFESENRVLDLWDSMKEPEYRKALEQVDGLAAIVAKAWPDAGEDERHGLMEFVVEGLHQNFLITKLASGNKVVYTDAVSHMMGQFDD